MNKILGTWSLASLVLPLAMSVGAAACSDDSEGGSSSTSATTTTTTTGQGGSTGSATTTGSTSSTGNGGSGAAGGGQGGSADACASALFCDDFEAQAPQAEPAAPWRVNKASGAVTVDTTRFYRGGKSVKVTTQAGGGYKSAMLGFVDESVLPTASNVVYGRMMFYLESVPTALVNWTFIEGAGTVPGASYPALYRYGGQYPIQENGTFLGSQLKANYETPGIYQNPPIGPATDCWHHSDKKLVPVGEWACAEWRFDGPNNRMQFWLNGVELPDLEVSGTGQGCVRQPADYTWIAPTFSRINVGWESYQADESRTMWIDDVAISTQPIGCPSAP